MQQAAQALRREGKTIGFVPTMGFLHEGHLSLMRIVRENADVLIRNNTSVYGAIVSGSITLDNHACFHYDRTLANIILGKTGEFLMVAWREL